MSNFTSCVARATGASKGIICRFIVSAACLTVVCVAVAAEPGTILSKDSGAKQRPSFTGTWKITEASPEGATKQAACLLFADDGTYSVLDKDGQELWAGTFEIVPTTIPKMWDHRSHDARKTCKDHLGIYELDGDKLR